VVRAIVELGRSLGIAVIAEGVETESQMTFLAGAGCGYGQGYYFREAVPAAEFGELLRNEAKVITAAGPRMLRPAV
jgi:EAL domain-containing protein (putative c-di-GMP-specific phosphodiesterase class I)